MKKNPYLPKRESQRVTWLNTFSSQLAIHGATVGVTAAEIAMVSAMALIYAYIIGLIDLSKAYTQELTKFKNKLSFAQLGAVLGPLPALTPGAAPALGPGLHAFDLSNGRALAPGVYFLRLTQNRHEVRARTAVLR